MSAAHEEGAVILECARACYGIAVTPQPSQDAVAKIAQRIAAITHPAPGALLTGEDYAGAERIFRNHPGDVFASRQAAADFLNARLRGAG